MPARVRVVIDGVSSHKHPLFGVWSGMRNRCSNPRSRAYRYYGARGIRVCARWSIFRLFVADMGPRPSGYVIDRVNNDGNYEPGNCRWATHQISARNRRNTVGAFGTRAARTVPLQHLSAGRQGWLDWGTVADIFVDAAYGAFEDLQGVFGPVDESVFDERSLGYGFSRLEGCYVREGF